MVETLKEYGLEPGENYWWFDCESFSEADSYMELFEGLVQITDGEFVTTNIEMTEGFLENRSHYVAELTFQLSGKIKNLRVMCDEWFDTDLITDLNLIIEKLPEISGRYYPIKTNDQSMIIVYAKSELFKKLEEARLIYDLNDYGLQRPEGFYNMKIAEV